MGGYGGANAARGAGAFLGNFAQARQRRRQIQAQAEEVRQRKAAAGLEWATNAPNVHPEIRQKIAKLSLDTLYGEPGAKPGKAKTGWGKVGSAFMGFFTGGGGKKMDDDEATEMLAAYTTQFAGPQDPLKNPRYWAIEPPQDSTSALTPYYEKEGEEAQQKPIPRAVLPPASQQQQPYPELEGEPGYSPIISSIMPPAAAPQAVHGAPQSGARQVAQQSPYAYRTPSGYRGQIFIDQDAKTAGMKQKVMAGFGALQDFVTENKITTSGELMNHPKGRQILLDVTTLAQSADVPWLDTPQEGLAMIGLKGEIPSTPKSRFQDLEYILDDEYARGNITTPRAAIRDRIKGMKQKGIDPEKAWESDKYALARQINDPKTDTATKRQLQAQLDGMVAIERGMGTQSQGTPYFTPKPVKGGGYEIWDPRTGTSKPWISGGKPVEAPFRLDRRDVMSNNFLTGPTPDATWIAYLVNKGDMTVEEGRFFLRRIPVASGMSGEPNQQRQFLKEFLDRKEGIDSNPASPYAPPGSTPTPPRPTLEMSPMLQEFYNNLLKSPYGK